MILRMIPMNLHFMTLTLAVDQRLRRHRAFTLRQSVSSARQRRDLFCKRTIQLTIRGTFNCFFMHVRNAQRGSLNDVLLQSRRPMSPPLRVRQPRHNENKHLDLNSMMNGDQVHRQV